ncbi:MAG: hypothetical protein HY709_07435 [Candidatus Latescibacteria bacterium]|nr:hypothetical protein [Candidatus Latescibacterota bacterium]
MSEHVESQNLGECFCAPYDVVLDRRTVVQPDMSFVSDDRSSIITDKNIQGAPDLVEEKTYVLLSKRLEAGCR